MEYVHCAYIHIEAAERMHTHTHRLYANIYEKKVPYHLLLLFVAGRMIKAGCVIFLPIDFQQAILQQPRRIDFLDPGRECFIGAFLDKG